MRAPDIVLLSLTRLSFSSCKLPVYQFNTIRNVHFLSPFHVSLARIPVFCSQALIIMCLQPHMPEAYLADACVASRQMIAKLVRFLKMDQETGKVIDVLYKCNEREACSLCSANWLIGTAGLSEPCLVVSC